MPMPPFSAAEGFKSMLQRGLLLQNGNQILLHHHICRSGLEGHQMLGDEIMFVLAQNGCMMHAREVFDRMSSPSSISWNNLITGYVTHGMPSCAVELYATMQERACLHHLDGHSLLSLLKACIQQKNLDMGSEIHRHIIEHNLLQTDAFLGSMLVDMYAKCGTMDKAYDAFHKLLVRDVVTWTALINGYVEHNHGKEALACVKNMQREGIVPDAFTFSSSLKACSIAGVLDEGQRLHADLTTIGLEENIVVSCSLVDMYAKNDCVREALKVFGSLSNRNMVTCNALLSGLIEHGHSEKMMECFRQLQNEGISLDFVTLTCVLQACAKMSLVVTGKEVHFLIVSKGGDADLSVGNTLLDMYAKCGLLAEAKAVFNSLPNKSVVSWNALIGGYAEHQQGEEALACFRKMQDSGASPDHISFLHVLKACSDIEGRPELQEIHAAVLKKGLEESLPVANTLVDVYMKHSMLVEARYLFDRQATKDGVSLAVLILGYAEHAYSKEVLGLLEQMQKDCVPFDAITYSCCTKVCASLGDAKKGYQLHAEIMRKGLEEDPSFFNSLFGMYVKCGLFPEAREIMDKLHVRSTGLWNTLIKGFMECELYDESLRCFELMQQEAITPDSVTCTCCLRACSSLSLINKGQELHCTIIKKGLDENVIVGSALIEAYTKWGLLEEAHQIFSTISTRTAFSWAVLMTGYVDFGYVREVLECWEQMHHEGVSPDVVIYMCALRASIKLAALDKGMGLHMEIVKRGVEQDCNVGCTLVLMYGKCDSFLEGKYVFDKLIVRTEITWTVLIAGYLEHGNGKEVLGCLEQMRKLGHSVCNIILAYGLRACAGTENMCMGQELCLQIFKRGMETDSMVSIAMIDMYAKCGLLLEAQRTFNGLSLPGSNSWTALTAGYANAGDSQAVFDFFDRMLIEGHCPDSVTFLNVLKACAHVGLMDHGGEYLECMITYYEILPNLEHCSCIIDLFARAGSLEKAVMMTDCMPFPPSIIVWQTLLGACCKWRNVELGTFLFGLVMELDESESAAYICISNIYAASKAIY